MIDAIANGPEPARQRLHAAVAAFVKRAMRNRRLAYALIAEPCGLSRALRVIEVWPGSVSVARSMLGAAAEAPAGASASARRAATAARRARGESPALRSRLLRVAERPGLAAIRAGAFKISPLVLSPSAGRFPLRPRGGLGCPCYVLAIPWGELLLVGIASNGQRCFPMSRIKTHHCLPVKRC